MIQAVLFSLLGGFFLAGFGIAISYLNKKGEDTFSYLFWNAFFTIPPAFFILGKPQVLFKEPLQRFPELFFWIVVGGVCSIGGSLCIQQAMKKGNNNIIWAIEQSSLLIPFLAGVIFFKQGYGIWQFVGAFLIVGGIFLPVIVAKNHSGDKGKLQEYLPLALLAFLLYGSSEAMQNVPSYWKNWRDVGELRSFLAYLGGTFGSASAAWFLKRKLWPIKSIWKIALGMAFWNLFTVKFMFMALDKCSAVNAGTIGYPIIVGSSIVFFAIYSIFVLKEKTSILQWVGLFAILLGIAVIAS